MTRSGKLGQQLNVDQFRNVLPAQSSVLGAHDERDRPGDWQPGLGGRATTCSGTASTRPAGRISRRLEMQAQCEQRRRRAGHGKRALSVGSGPRRRPCRASRASWRARPTPRPSRTSRPAIAAEQAYIQAQQVQAQALAMWQASQERNQQHRTRKSGAGRPTADRAGQGTRRVSMVNGQARCRHRGGDCALGAAAVPLSAAAQAIAAIHRTPPRTVELVCRQPKARASVQLACLDDPGRLGGTPDCVNADRANVEVGHARSDGHAPGRWTRAIQLSGPTIRRTRRAKLADVPSQSTT